jgi:hypothetical protein
MRIPYKILAGKLEGNRPLEISRRKSEEIEMDAI